MCKLTRNYSLRVAGSVLAIVILMIAAASLVQVKGAGQSPETILSVTQAPGDDFFKPAVTYDTGLWAGQWIAVADVNGDGNPDLLVTVCCDAAAVLLNNSDGTFQPAATYYPGGFFPRGIASADVNGDGFPDLLVANEQKSWDAKGGVVGVLLGNGNGTFRPAVAYDSGGLAAKGVAIADVNGDGHPDLLVSNSNNVAVLLGKGDGTFSLANSYDGGGDSIATADVNHDAKLDLMVGSSVGVFLRLGNGNGTFQAAQSYDPGGSGQHFVAVADLNHDGKLDLVVGNSGTNSVGVLLGGGDGTFLPAVTYPLGGMGASSVAITDVDGDGQLDVLVTNYCASPCYTDHEPGVLSVLPGNGDGTLKPALTYPTGGIAAMSLAIADVNMDGKPDALIANSCNSHPRREKRCQKSVVGVLMNDYGPHGATETALASSRNPSPPGEPIILTATVKSVDGGVVTGTVEFRNYYQRTLARVPLDNGVATFTWQPTIKGIHRVIAAYLGSGRYTASSSPWLIENVRTLPVNTMLSISASPSPSWVGQPVTFTAKVWSKFGKVPDGEQVTFYHGTEILGAVALSDGLASYTIPSLAAPRQFISATYPGDPQFKTETGYLWQTVNKYPTTTTLSSTPNPSGYGQAVTFTATVTSGGPIPAGKVRFTDGATAIGSAALSGGVATLTKSKLAVGTHPITAQYLGDAASAKSTSSLLDQVVQ